MNFIFFNLITFLLITFQVVNATESNIKTDKYDQDKNISVKSFNFKMPSEENLQKLINNNPFYHQDKSKALEAAKKIFDNKKILFISKICPGVIPFTAQMISDKEIGNSFIKIIIQKEKLKRYSYFVIITFVVYLFYLFLSPEKRFFIKLLKKLIALGFMSMLNLSAFYFQFQKELTPLTNAIKLHLF